MLLSVAIFIVLALWLAAVTFWLYKNDSHYKRLVATGGKTDLKGILERLLSGQANLAQHLKKVENEIGELDKMSGGYIQKVGLVKFNPFSDTGSNQSFALALLDGKETGIILLCLHSRDGTRIYVKDIASGKSRYGLSQEEKQALEQAIKKS